MHLKVALVGIGLQVRAVGVEHPPTNQPVLERLLDDAIKDLLFDVRPGKPPSPVLRQRRGVRHLVGQAKSEKPPVRHIDFDLLEQTALRADAEQVANEQHLEQHDRVDRRTSIVLAIQVTGGFADEVEADVTVEQTE